MSRVLLGVICGLVFGAIDIGIMLPMSFPDKKAAITAAFIARFGIGFAVGAARLPWPGWVVGLCFGLLPAAVQKHYEDTTLKWCFADGRQPECARRFLRLWLGSEREFLQRAYWGKDCPHLAASYPFGAPPIAAYVGSFMNSLAAMRPPAALVYSNSCRAWSEIHTP